LTKFAYTHGHTLVKGTPVEVWDLAPASASAGARLVAATPFKGGTPPIEAHIARGSCLDGAGEHPPESTAAEHPA
jgi:hypothetical protein